MLLASCFSLQTSLIVAGFPDKDKLPFFFQNFQADYNKIQYLLQIPVEIFTSSLSVRAKAIRYVRKN